MISASRWFFSGLYFLFASFAVNLSLLPTTASAAPKLFDVSIVELAGRAGHQGLFPIQDQPIQGAQAGARVRLIGAATNVNLLLLDASGNLLSRVPTVAPSPTQAVSGTFFADIVIPTRPFTFGVSGIDASGIPFSLVQTGSAMVVPQTLQVRLVPAFGELSQTLPNLIAVQVTNFGAADTVNVTLTSDDGAAATPANVRVFLAPRQSTSIRFDFSLRASAMGMLTLKATASSARAGGIGNTALLQLPVAILGQARLIAFFGEHDRLLRDEGSRLTDIWVCDASVDVNTIVLANGEIPLTVKQVPLKHDITRSSRDDAQPSLDDCGTRSALKLSFDTASLVATITAGSFPTSQRRREQQVDLPIMAFATDGTQLIGYVTVRVKVRDGAQTSGGDYDH